MHISKILTTLAVLAMGGVEASTETISVNFWFAKPIYVKSGEMTDKIIGVDIENTRRSFRP